MKILLYKIKHFFAIFPNRLRKTSVKAVYDSDLVSLVESMGIKNAIENGSYSCKFCNTPITFENLQAIQKDGGKLKIICSSIECLNKI